MIAGFVQNSSENSLSIYAFLVHFRVLGFSMAMSSKLFSLYVVFNLVME